MKINQKGIDLIKNFESLHDGDLRTIGLQPKMCPVQIWTVGWGHAIVDPLTRKFLKGTKDQKRALELYSSMTEQEAEMLLKRDLTAFSSGVTRALKVKLTENQFSALVSFAYNVGIGNYNKSTLLRLINANPNNPQIEEQFLRWNRGGGKVLNGLTRRRTAEAKLYFSK
jgi:lysozyme